MERYIRRVRIEGMFGNESEMVVDFDPHDNCIYGVNGSGKTVLINLIVAALQVDISVLLSLPFKSLKVITSPIGGRRELSFITLTREGESITYLFSEKLQVKNEVENRPGLSSTLLSLIEKDKPYKFSVRHTRDESWARTMSLRTAIKRIVSLTYVPLLRMHDSSGRSDEVLMYELRRQRMSEKEISELLDPNMRVLKRLQQEFSERYTAAQSQIAAELEALKSTIFEKLLFQNSSSKDDAVSYVQKIIETRDTDTGQDADNVIKHIKDLNLNVSEQMVREHFKIWAKAKENLLSTYDALQIAQEKKGSKRSFAESEYKNYSQSYFNLVASVRQFRKFEEVIQLINDMQNKKSMLLSKFNKFKSEINVFLSQGKSISFNETGLFKVDKDGMELELQSLSSGEKHLLVILGRVCLSSFVGSTVFIADEPELSLHLEWQREILPAISRLSPETQIIVATHSPAIISSKAKKINLRTCYKNG